MSRGGTAGLVLAAGAGRRFGGPKAVLQIDGERLVDRAVRTLAAGGCAPVLVVSGAVDLDVEGAQVVANPLWDTGMGSSLTAGLRWLAERPGLDSDAVVVLLVDTPWVSADAVRRVREAGPDAAAVATYDGRRGHPVLLPARVWDDVAALALGDTAAKGWLATHPDQVTEVDCTGLGDPRDVDRPDDLTSPGSPDRP